MGIAATEPLGKRVANTVGGLVGSRAASLVGRRLPGLGGTAAHPVFLTGQDVTVDGDGRFRVVVAH